MHFLILCLFQEMGDAMVNRIDGQHNFFYTFFLKPYQKSYKNFSALFLNHSDQAKTPKNFKDKCFRVVKMVAYVLPVINTVICLAKHYLFSKKATKTSSDTADRTKEINYFVVKDQREFVFDGGYVFNINSWKPLTLVEIRLRLGGEGEENYKRIIFEKLSKSNYEQVVQLGNTPIIRLESSDLVLQDPNRIGNLKDQYYANWFLMDLPGVHCYIKVLSQDEAIQKANAEFSNITICAKDDGEKVIEWVKQRLMKDNYQQMFMNNKLEFTFTLEEVILEKSNTRVNSVEKKGIRFLSRLPGVKIHRQAYTSEEVLKKANQQFASHPKKAAIISGIESKMDEYRACELRGYAPKYTLSNSWSHYSSDEVLQEVESFIERLPGVYCDYEKEF